MKSRTDNLSLIQAERRTARIKKILDAAQVRPGWIKYLREVLGMTLKDLAKRSGSSLPTVAQAERREKRGAVTIGTLKKMAAAMDCDFVYAFVPKKNLRVLIREKAIEKAKKLLENADTHMTLEDQRVQESYEARVRRLAEKLIERGDVW